MLWWQLQFQVTTVAVIMHHRHSGMHIAIRGVPDVGFPIFADADTDADFAF